MIKLTRQNYHTIENNLISSSKVRDFLKSKELYYRRHIEGSLSSDETNSITLGRIVDRVLYQGTTYHFYRTYRLKVLKKEDAEQFAKQKTLDDRRILTPVMYYQLIAICEKALRSPFYLAYKDKKVKSFKQLILQMPYEFINESIATPGICGMLDRLTFNGNTAYIDDFKTSAMGNMRSAKGWVYNCYGSNYFVQMAVYRWLVQQIYPEFEHYVCRHIVLGTSKTDLYPIRLYVIPDTYIDEAEKIFFNAVRNIVLEQDWIDPLPAWEEAETLPTPEEMDHIIDNSMSDLEEIDKDRG